MGKKWLLAIAGSLVMFTLAACGGNAEGGGDTVSTLSGQELYGQSCASCHGGDLRSGYAPDLDKIGDKYSAEEIEDIIVNGIGQMPKGVLKGEDAKKVSEWLMSQ